MDENVPLKERESTITPEDVEKILKDSEKHLPELRERLAETFRKAPRNIRLD